MPKIVYLVVEPMPIVAADLAYTLQDLVPAADVLVADTEEQALQLLADHDSVHVAIVHADPRRFPETDLGRNLAARGTVCVHIGDAAERSGPDRGAVLERPFSTESVASLLSRLAVRTAVESET